MLPWVLGVAAAIGAQATPTPWHLPPVKVLTGPVVLARGRVVLPGDRKPATIELWMMSGKAAPEGCAMNYLLCGRVAFQVKRKGHPTALTSVNELVGKEEMCFDPPLGVPFRVEDLDESDLKTDISDVWPLEFSDFNHDGTPDLALGAHTCHDNGAYFLFTFSSLGEAHRLPIDHDGVMWAPVGRGLMPDMSELKMTADGFQITLIDRSTDSVIEFASRYRWNPTAGSFSVTTEQKELPPPR